MTIKIQPGKSRDVGATIAAPGIAPAGDMSGQDRMTRNVLASWAGHLVFIASGFIMPRLIDGQLGQGALGIWDFGWSLVAYFNLVQGGVISSINRYVAKHRAMGDVEGLNRCISSATAMLTAMAGIILLFTLIATFSVPRLLGRQLIDFVGDAEWVVFFFGMSLAIQTPMAAFGGVISGCHRWDLYSAIQVGGHLITVGGMVTVLLVGGGLPWLALMPVGGEAFSVVARCVMAYRVCPHLRVRLCYMRWSAARSMLTFGGKSFVLTITELLVNQTTSVLVIAYLGPAALALYSRPASLVGHVTMLVRKFTFVLGPTSSSLHAAGQRRQLQELMLKATRYGAYISLPMILTLAIMGGPILRLWMGARYTEGLLLALLALGRLPSTIQESVLGVLWGMNAHGRPAVAKFVAAICTAVMVTAALGVLQWGIVGAAVAVMIPLTIVDGIYVPLYGCRRLGMPVSRYVRESLRGPVLCMIPFAFCLVASRVIFAGSPLFALAVAAPVGSAVLGVLYWRGVLPESLKSAITRRLRLTRVRRAPLARTEERSLM